MTVPMINTILISLLGVLIIWSNINAYRTGRSMEAAAGAGSAAQAKGQTRYDVGREHTLELEQMFDHLPVMLWTARADGYIDYYNLRWYEYTGMRPQEMEGWGWQSVHNPEVLPLVLERWKASLETGEPFEMEFPIRSSSGEFCPFLTRVVPVKDAQGRVTRWFGTNTQLPTKGEQ